MRNEYELVTLVADLTVPGSTRIPLSTRLDLVRGGVRVRLNDRPPLAARLSYKWLGHGIAPQWNEWVRDDIDSRSYPFRSLRLLPVILGMCTLSTINDAAWPLLAWAVWLMIAASSLHWVLLAVFRPERSRRMARKAQGIAPDGTFAPQPAVPVPALYVGWVLRTPTRTQIWPLWLALGISAVVVVVVLAPLPVLVGCFACGAVLLAIAVRRAPGRLAARQLEAAPVSAWRTRAYRIVMAATIAVLSGVFVAAAEVGLVERNSAALLAAIGGVLGPYAIFMALLARRIERQSGVVVTTAELRRATIGRRALREPSARWRPSSPPCGQPTSAR